MGWQKNNYLIYDTTCCRSKKEHQSFTIQHHVVFLKRILDFYGNEGCARNSLNILFVVVVMMLKKG